MTHISTVSTVPLTHHSASEGLAMGAWKAIPNFEGGWSGKVVVQCNTKDELRLIYRAIQDKGISVQGHNTSLSLQSNFLNLGNPH